MGNLLNEIPLSRMDFSVSLCDSKQILQQEATFGHIHVLFDLNRDFPNSDGLLQDIAQQQCQLCTFGFAEIFAQKALDIVQFRLQDAVVRFHDGRTQYQQGNREIARLGGLAIPAASCCSCFVLR